MNLSILKLCSLAQQKNMPIILFKQPRNLSPEETGPEEWFGCSTQAQIEQNQNGACEMFCQNKRLLMIIMVNGFRLRTSIRGVKTEKIPRQYPKLSPEF